MTLPAQDIVERFWPAACDSIDGPHASTIHQMIQDGNGGYVRFSDYKSLTADNEALLKERDEARAAHHRTSHKAVKRLRALWREKQAAEASADALAQEVERKDAALRKIIEIDDAGDMMFRADGPCASIALAALGDRP